MKEQNKVRISIIMPKPIRRQKQQKESNMHISVENIYHYFLKYFENQKELALEFRKLVRNDDFLCHYCTKSHLISYLADIKLQYGIQKGPEITITNINDLKNQIINSSQIAFDLYFHYFVDLLQNIFQQAEHFIITNPQEEIKNNKIISPENSGYISKTYNLIAQKIQDYKEDSFIDDCNQSSQELALKESDSKALLTRKIEFNNIKITQNYISNIQKLKKVVLQKNRTDKSPEIKKKCSSLAKEDDYVEYLREQIKEEVKNNLTQKLFKSKNKKENPHRMKFKTLAMTKNPEIKLIKEFADNAITMAQIEYIDRSTTNKQAINSLKEHIKFEKLAQTIKLNHEMYSKQAYFSYLKPTSAYSNSVRQKSQYRRQMFKEKLENSRDSFFHSPKQSYCNLDVNSPKSEKCFSLDQNKRRNTQQGKLKARYILKLAEKSLNQFRLSLNTESKTKPSEQDQLSFSKFIPQKIFTK